METERIVELWPTLIHTLRKFLASHPFADKQDAESDAMLGLLTAVRSYNDSCKLSTFVKHRMFWTMLDGERRKTKRGKMPNKEQLQDAADVHVPPPLDAQDEFLSLIRLLPHRERLLMQLYYVHDLTVVKFAKVLGVSESRVSQMHADALKELRCVAKKS